MRLAVIGSRELAQSATGDFNGDGLADLALPSADRRAIVSVEQRVSVALSGHAAAVAETARKLVILLDDGRLVTIAP